MGNLNVREFRVVSTSRSLRRTQSLSNFQNSNPTLEVINSVPSGTPFNEKVCVSKKYVLFGVNNKHKRTASETIKRRHMQI